MDEERFEAICHIEDNEVVKTLLDREMLHRHLLRAFLVKPLHRMTDRGYVQPKSVSHISPLSLQSLSRIVLQSTMIPQDVN
jgi:hypothetical protein